MATRNTFLSSPFDNLSPEGQTSVLPGQQQALPPLELPKVEQPKLEQPDTRQPAAVSGNLMPPPAVRPIFEAAAREFDVPVNVLMALGHQESRYNPQAIGPETQWGRARGMMQYLDDTAKGLGINPFDPAQAIPAAARQIRERLDKGYSMEDAVKEHFAGPNRKLWGKKTDAYGREVMEKVGKLGEALGSEQPASNPKALQAQLDQEEPGRYRVVTPELNTQLMRGIENRDADVIAGMGLGQKAEVPKEEASGFLDRSGEALARGMANTVQSLSTARFALGAGGDSAELAQSLASKFEAESKRKKTAGEQEIDTAFNRVTEAKGAWNTTVEGLKAIGAAASNPKDLAIGVLEQAPNMLPTLGAGAAGAGAGAGVGAGAGALLGGVGAIPGAVTGAIWGSRAGMVAGTTATELGAEVEQMVLERLTADKKAPTAANIKTLLDDKAFQSEARERGLKKGLTVAAVDQLFFGLTGKVAGKAAAASTVGRKAALSAGAVGLDATGEVVGEAASQQVARGEVDAGDALREGVYGLGQSVVEPAISGAARGAKAAADAMRPQASQPASAAPSAPAPAAPAAAPAPAAPAPGPLSAAVEKVAEPTEQRVTVTAPEGQITGFVESYQDDGQGGFAARVLGDDGQVYQFTNADQVTITPEAPKAGPLTAAVEAVAAAQPEPAATTEAPAAPVAAAPVKAPAAKIENGADPLLGQAQALVTGPDGRASTSYVQRKLQIGYNRAARLLEDLEKLGVVSPMNSDGLRNVLAKSAPVKSAPVTQPAQPGTTGKGAGYAKPTQAAAPAETTQQPKALSDMTEPELRERMRYIAGQAKLNGGWNKDLTAARKEVEREINGRAKPVEQAEAPKAEQAAPVAQPGASYGTMVSEHDTKPEAMKAMEAFSAATVAKTEGGKWGVFTDQKPSQPAADATLTDEGKTEPASAPDKDPHAGKWFGSREKADAYVAKRKISDTHEIVQTGKVRFEVKPKDPTNDQRTDQQPAGTEAVGQEADAGQAAAAPVQPVAGPAEAEVTQAAQAEPQQAAATPAEEAASRASWWDKELTGAGRRAVLEAAGVSRPDRVQWERLDAETQKGLWKNRAAAEQTAPVQAAGAKRTATVIDNTDTNNGEYIVRGADGSTILARFEIGRNAAPVRVKYFYEASATRNEADAAIAKFMQDRKEASDKLWQEGTSDQAAPATEIQTKPVSVTKAGAGATAIVIDPGAASAAAPQAEAKAANVSMPAAEIDTSAKPVEATDSADAGLPERFDYGPTGNTASPAARELRKLSGHQQADSDVELGNGKFVSLDVAVRYAKEAINAGIRPVQLQLAYALDLLPGEANRVIAAATAQTSSKPSTTAQPVEAAAKPDPFAGNKLFTSDRVAAARERLKKKLSGSQFNSGIDPELLMDGIIIAGGHIESGTRAFAAYAKAMVDDIGEEVKPYLLSFYEAARNYPGLDTEGMTPVDQAKTEFDKLIQPADLEKAQEAIGEITPKPAKRTKKTGAKADMTLTQDWGVEHIDGYGDTYDRETGNDVKDAFLKEAKTYLNTVAGILAEQGFAPYTDAKGRPQKAVSVNESGVATSGDVTLTLTGPNGIGIYAHIGGTSLRGVVPTSQSGVSVMMRVTQEGDRLGTKDRNRWMPVDLSAADLANSMLKAVSEFKPTGKQDAATLQSQAVPARDTGADQGNAAAGDGNRQPVDAGLAAGDQGAAEVGPVPGSAESTGAGGARGTEPAGQQPSGTARDRAGVRPEPESSDFVIDAEDIGKGGLTKKYRDNVAAIRILKAMETDGRVATPEERKQLAKYVGWGAMKGPFDPENKQWAKQHAELKKLLTDAEFRAARKSTLDAHFTSPVAVGAMNDALARLGYKGGRMLEPSVGIGNFYGLMPAAVRNASQLYGVELDSLTSRMVAALYPKAKIAKATGFEDFQIPAQFFDLVQGNPPFGSQPLVDAERSPYSGFSIHNYFLAKGIDKLRPGGIMQVVVSHNFLDAQDNRARKWISERASLIGAVRLPNTAFQENAGTQVVTDILIFQKHDANGVGRPDIVDGWVDVAEQVNTNPKTGESVTHKVSPVFVQKPNLVLGKPSAGGTMYSANEYTVEATGDIKPMLDTWVQSLPENVYRPIERKPEAETDMAVPDGVKVGSYYVDAAGEIMQRGDDLMGNKTAQPWAAPNAKAAERMKGMIGLRETLRTQMRLERSPDATESEIEANRATLNQLYDDFLKKNGHLNSQTNRRLFLDDTEAQLVQALEFDYDKGISKAVAEKEGIDPREPSAVKADIFNRRVAFPPQDFLTVTTPKDALLASLNYRGKVDTAYMEEVYGKPAAQIVEELGDVVFDDPQAGIVTADEYLSGDVKTKLAEAKAAGEKYRRNVEALEKVIPADKKPSEIAVSIGAAFVPAEVYQEFVKHISGGEGNAAYIKATGQWLLAYTGQTEPALNTGKFGTDQLSAQELFQLSMLGRGAVVKKTVRNADGSTTTILMEKETEAAREKQNAIKAEWKSWLWSDPARAEKIASIYNDKMNRIVERKYDGSHLSFPGMNPAISLLEHQKNGVWRGLQSYQVLYDHVVGAGKTFEMATLAMEMRRLGIARKPLFVVPNHLTLQWRSEFTRLYPGSNILAATPEDFAKGNRERLFSKIVTGDWDAVVVGHSSLKKIGLPEETEKAVLQEQIDEVSAAVEDMKRARGDRNIIRDMEGIRARLEAKMKDKLAAIGKRDKVVTFDELGIDAMFIDEMHEFKNLAYNSTMDRNPGMGNPAGSAKAFDLFVKTRWLFDTFGEKTPYITATGTPVSNSLVEMFNMQRYMQYPTLKAQGLHVFDAWAKQFGSVENVYEVAPSGSGYRQSTRFAKFTNLPGLMSLYNSFADTITLDDLKAQEEAQGKRFPVPKLVGGKPQIVVAKRSPAVSNLMGVPMAQTDEAGQIRFAINPEVAPEIKQDPQTGKWSAKAYRTLADGSNVAVELGAFDTEQDARLKVVEKALTPEVSVDPDSILGRFGRLKQLTKETKGKVNALSLTGEANKAGLDYRLIDPAAPDFEGSKINLAVGNMVRIYKQWNADKGTQLVFCDLSIPLSARASYSSKARRLYVRDEAGAIDMKRGTMHTLEGQESLPYFVVQRGEKDLKRFDVYDAASGAKIGGDFRTKQDAIDQSNALLADENRRQRWIDRREAVGEISQEAIDEFNNENDIEADGIEAFTREDIAGVSGAAKFSVYDDIKAKLIAKGIPEREIAFIHDYGTPTAKDKLFKAVNSGEIRFLLGSTPKMGAGTNVQKRLVGLHHIDAPWRPSDLEQREGRIIRRGNELYFRDPEGFEVFIGRYATEQTYDTRRWQILEHKARGIEQLRNFDGSINEIDDIEGEAANAADMKAAASGDPLILEETRLKNDVRRLEQLQAAHADDVVAMNRKARAADEYAKKTGPQLMEGVKALNDEVKKHKLDKDGFAPITIDGKTFDTKEAAQKEIEQAVSVVRTGLREESTIVYRGVQFDVWRQGAVLTAESPTGNLGSWTGADPFSASGFVQRMKNYVDRLPAQIESIQASIDKSAKDAVALREEAKKPFGQAADLQAAREAYKGVQRALLAKGPAVPDSQKPAVAAGIKAQKARLEAMGYGEQLREFFAGSNEPRYSVRPDGTVEAEFGPVITGLDPAAAVERLMDEKAGEAIVTRPDLGDISLIYGDETSGLQHIAARRGDDILRRLPGLIANGALYTKPGQVGRVFLGNDRDEAVLRLDWNGQAKTWLLSVYEKYPDLKASKPAQVSRRSQTVAERSASGLTVEGARQAITSGVIGPAMRALIDNGAIVLHSTAKTLPKGSGRNVRGVQAVTAPDGTIHVVANSVTSQTARAVTLHEMFHRGGEALIGTEQWGKMMGRLGSLYNQSEKSTGRAREFFDRARDRVAAAKQQGAVATRMEVEEFGAYAIEEYERAPGSLPAAIRKWVEDFIGLVKAWAVKAFGKQVGQITPAQLAALAKMAALDAATQNGVMSAIDAMFSVADPINSPAFKRWFGDSKVVDAKGKPLVVYRGGPGTDWRTDRPITEFRSSNGPWAGFFSSLPEVGSRFASAFRGGVVTPVYINISKPLEVDAGGRKAREFQIDASAIGKADSPIRDQLLSGYYDGLILRNTADEGDVFVPLRPEQIKSAIGNNGDFDPTNPDIRYSVKPEDAGRLIDDASKALDDTGPVAKADYIGRVVGDIGLGAKLIVHPRTVAAVHPEFTPVYRTAISQMETRDEIIAELGRGVKPYDMLDQAGKENVNKALELGRLTSNVYSPADLKKGVTNTGTRKVVVIGDDGKPKTATVPITSLLSQTGDVITLTDEEIEAYKGLRATFDRALDMMRDQTLDELGFPELIGKPNAAKAIRDLITEDMPADQAEKLANIAKFVAEIEQAKRAGYVPFARYGDYVVTVKEKTVNLDYQDDGAGNLTITNAPDSMAEDLLGLGAEQVAGGWKVKASKKNEVERLTERTVYSAKVETGLKDFIASRKAQTVEDIPAVREAIEKARAEHVGDNPARRIVAFKAREKKSDQPVRLSDVDALAEIASIDNETWDAVRDKLADAIKSKGFRKHFFHSDNVPGYTGDFERSIADYVIGMAGYLSRRQHMKRWDNSVTAITDKSKLFEYASKYRQYVNDPQEELAMVRQIGFFSYIAGVFASAFANLTQVPMLTVPTLSQVAPTALVMKEIGRAYKDALAMMGRPSRVGLDMFDPTKAPADVRDVLMEAWDEGSFVPLETFDLMMTARQRNVGARKGVKAFNTATQVVSVAFTFAERLNRLVTFIAAARMANKPAVKANAARVLAGDALARQTTLGRNWNAKNFAEWVVDESQYRMGKANRPTMMRGVGSALMQFKGFMIQTFEAWYRMAALHGRDGQMAALASLASVVAIGGLWGLPGADDLRKLIEAAYKQITGMDLDMKTELRAWVAKTSGSNAVAQMVAKGASYPLGVDLTRVGFGSVVPDSPLAAAGIPFDMLIGRPKRAFEKASTDDYMGAAAEFTPNFIKNMLVAGSWRLDGVRDKQGNLILTPDELRGTDIGMKAIGFQPSIVTDVRDYEYAQRRQETAVDGLKRSYTNKIAKLIGQMERTEDPAKLKELDARLGEVYDDIAEHNATADPEQVIQISPRAIRNRVARELDGVKATWGRERKAARGAADDMRGVFGLEQDE